MTTPIVTELIRNGNPVEDRAEPARPVSPVARPPAPIPSISVLGAEDRRAVARRRVASPPAERTPALQLAA